MVELLGVKYAVDPYYKQKMIDLEFLIVKNLKFEFECQSPIMFLERFLRLFGMDQTTNCLNLQIQESTLEFLFFISRKADFLDYSPSQQAAAAIIFAIKLSYSFLAPKIGLN